jgi:hypothetical protein
LFEVGGIGGQVGPIKSNEDSLAIDGVLGEKLTVSILELADLRWIEDANFAVGPIESPLVGLRIVHAQGQAFDVAGWTADFDLVNTGAIVTLRQTPVPSNSTQVVEPVKGCRRRLR